MNNRNSDRIKKYLPLVLWAAVILFCLIKRDLFTAENIMELTPENVLAAFAVFQLLFALKSISLVIYSGVIFAASGLVFPLGSAFFVNLTGIAVMVSVPYFIGYRKGSGVIKTITERYPKTGLLMQLSTANDFLFSMLARLVAVIPSDPLSMYMGASRVSFPKFLAGSMAGFLPEMVAFTVIGEHALEPGSLQFMVSAAVELGIILFSILYCRRLIKQKN